MITLALLLLLNTAGIDPKMRLDLNIAENILTELLKQNGAPATFVKGSHIPGFGVILELSYRRHSVQMTGSQVAGVDVDELVQRYLNDYGDLITGIGADESISVTYSSRASASKTIMTVRKRDVADRRSGKITEAVFKSRIRKQQVDAAPDAEIFAKVVETAVNADTSRVFSLRHVTASTLPGFGLLVTGSLSSGGFAGAPMAFQFRAGGGEELEIARVMATEAGSEPRAKEVRIVRGQPGAAPGTRAGGNDSIRVEVDVDVVNGEIRGNLDGLREDIVVMRNNVDRIRETRRRTKEEMTAAYVSLEALLKSVIIDYGRTLGSLKTGESLMVRIDSDRAPEGLPKSMTFTISKSVLNDFDRRAVTKEQASAKIVVVKE